MAVATESIDIRLLQLETELKNLHLIYEKHFSGLIKLEPLKEHQKFKKDLSFFNPAELKTTAAKFRFQATNARYIQYQQHWEKIQKQIEEGTYKRDLFLLEKKIEWTASQKRPDWASPNKSPQKAEPALNASTSRSNTQRQLEDLYEKVRLASPNPTKIPSKEKFIASIQRELLKQNEKHPGKPVSIGLGKDANGQIQVKIAVKKA